MFCSKCGAKNNDDAKYCVECGVGLNIATASNSSQSVASSATSLTDAERGIVLTADYINSTAFNELLGEKAVYYRESFLRIYELKKQSSYDLSQIREASGFNLWAGLLSPIWLGYRGIYKMAFFYVLLEACQFSQYTTGMSQLISFVVNYAIVGYLGNYWYYNSLNQKLFTGNEGKPVLAKSIGDGIFFLVASIGAAYAFNSLIEMAFAR